MDFEQRLQSELDNDLAFRRSAGGRRVANVLNMNPRRKARVLARMEAHAVAHLGKTPADWKRVSAIDLKGILELLAKILPLLLLFL